MPKPYSYDFRRKVIEAIELDGMPKTWREPKVSRQPQYHQALATTPSPNW